MKKILFLIFVFLAVFFINDSDAAVCCDTGCYTLANICCGPTGQKVGVEGCLDSNSQYHCPGENIGQCLECSDDNEWVEDTVGIQDCNACLAEYDANGNPIISSCDSRCPEGTVLCNDESCSENCGPAGTYSACSGNSCLELIGDYSDDCSVNGQCTNPPPDLNLFHAECTIDGQCVQVSGAGTDSCNRFDDCPVLPPGSPSHKLCGSNNGCLQIAGAGVDTCSSDNQCDIPNPFYMGCTVNNQCVVVNGDRGFTCADNVDCADIPDHGGSACNLDGECTEGEDSCQCADCGYKDQDTCLPGLVCSKERRVCSGDNDDDNVLNDDDVCVDVPDSNQKDEDGDCYLPNGKRSPLFGYCGDACEGQGICDEESLYGGGKQCCDGFEGTQGDGKFFGFTEDCPQIPGGVGCWSICFKQVGNDFITYESGACIDNVRIIKELTNKVVTNSFQQSCIGIPLVPFFTGINILITILILSGYYAFRRK